MTPTLARNSAIARRARWIAKLMVAATLLCAPEAMAAPLGLDSDADIAAFAEKLRAYGSASRIRWVVAGATRADALSTIAKIESRLPAPDRALAARLSPQSLADAGAPTNGPSVRAWISPQIGASASGAACSWQVWVTDPSFPSAEADPITVPLAPNDRLPVSRSATFRVGHSGLLQNRLYAFDETRPGAIRDLAMARDVNVPVATDEGMETILLASARENAPQLERVKNALSASDGQRRELGPEFALRDKLLGEGRGIGANILAIPSDMIAPKGLDKVAVNSSKGSSTALVETCLYALTPAH